MGIETGNSRDGWDADSERYEYCPDGPTEPIVDGGTYPGDELLTEVGQRLMGERPPFLFPRDDIIEGEIVGPGVHDDENPGHPGNPKVIDSPSTYGAVMQQAINRWMNRNNGDQ